MNKQKSSFIEDSNSINAQATKPNTMSNAYAPRIALMNCFYRATLHRFVYANAPTGSGKTITALLWLNECGRKAVWISLDESDNTSTAFYKQLAFALASSQPENEEMNRILTSPSFSATPIAHVLRLLKAFQSDGEMYALVFDDIHHIRIPVVIKSLAAILQMLPPSFAVLFLSREEPPKYLREIIKPTAFIKPEQFLFTEDEIRWYFEHLGRSISSNEVKVVHTSTGGLPIGVSAVVKTGEIRLGQDGFDAANFLTAHLLDGWSVDIQDFMQKTCVTDDITPALADKLTGLSDSNEKLDWLCAENAYITKIDNDTYRYHKMFLDLLRSRTGGIAPSVYKIAGGYYLEKGDLRRALNYYSRSGSYKAFAPSFAAILEMNRRYGPQSISLIEHLGVVRRMNLESLSATAEESRPFIYLWCLWKHYLLGDTEAACAYIDKLQDLAANLPGLSMIKHYVVAFHYLDIRKKLSEIQNELEKAEGAAYVEERYNMFVYTMNMPFISRSSRDSSEYANNIEEIEKNFSDNFRILMGEHYALYVQQLKAELYFEKNMLEEAENAAAVSVSIPKLWNKPDYAFSHSMLCAAIAFASGKTKETSQAFDAMEAYIKENGYEYLLPNLIAVKTKRTLYDADKNAAQDWLNLYFVTEPIGEPLAFYKVYRHFTTARAYIVLGRYGDALNLLEKLKRQGAEFMRPLDIAEAGVLQAIVEWAEGKKDKAVTTLEETLIVIQPYGFVRIIANEGGSVMPVLKRLASKVGRQTYTGALYSGYINEVSIASSQFSKFHCGLFEDAERNAKILKLSKRQKQVLDLLSKGYKNERIAQEMGLDIMTVRGHLTKAYRKLGVHTGIEAVVKARELGVIK